MKINLRNKRLRNALFYLTGIIIVIIVLNNFLLPWYVSSPEVKVPNVIGMTEEEAFRVIKDADLMPVVADSTFDEKFPKGTVMMQNPKGGRVVKEGRRTYVFISSGEPVITVPLLKGRSLRDARLALERIGLKLGQVEELPSSNPKDMVFDQQFTAGTPLKKGESVNVSISIGQAETGDIIVPDVIGKSLIEAERVLSDSSLIIGKINYQPSFSLLPNTVLDQYPSKGNKVGRGERVDLFVTKAADMPEEIIEE
jgi:eukaryotic-like serine/threonine-protein kinase